MKNYLSIIIFFLLTTFSSLVYSQAPPQGLNYSSVIRDNNGKSLVNRNVSLRFSIISGSPSGMIEYQEIHVKMTDQWGIVNLPIGMGSIVQGDFTTIEWGTDTYYLQIELDENSGSNYKMMGTVQFLSVPYALYAETSGSGVTSDTSATNEIQTLSVDDDSLSISGANSIPLSELGAISSGSLDFPDGINNLTPISTSSDYTVPLGKNLYITNVNKATPNGNHDLLFIDNILVIRTLSTVGFVMPIIVGSNQTVTLEGSSIIFNGFLVDAIVSPITIPLSNSYTVPAGKELYITRLTATGNGVTFYIDGQKFINDVTNFPERIPLIIDEGSVINSIGTNQTGVLNGYLK